MDDRDFANLAEFLSALFFSSLGVYACLPSVRFPFSVQPSRVTVYCCLRKRCRGIAEQRSLNSRCGLKSKANGGGIIPMNHLWHVAARRMEIIFHKLHCLPPVCQGMQLVFLK